MLADAVANHRSWFGRGRARVELDGVDLFLGPGDATLAFPEPDADLEEAVRRARAAGAREVGCWAVAPDDALGAELRRLGFQDGWQPHWMAADPRRARGSPPHEVERTTACDPGLPYASAQHARMLGGDAHHLVVRSQAAIVGHGVLNVEEASGGIYDMGVAPRDRRRGYGLALTLAALDLARELGCESVTLNATSEGEPVYRRAGFGSLGHGMTWWLFPRGS